MSFKELLAVKHPTAWVDFELGAISEQQMLQSFFSDGRPVDGEALKAMLVSLQHIPLFFVVGMLLRYCIACFQVATLKAKLQC